MKKNNHIIALLLILTGCTANEDFNASTETSPWETVGYIPKGTPEEITLACGQKVFMDIDSTYYFQDIIFTREQIELMDTPSSRSVVKKGIVNYWPQKSIPYIIQNGFTNAEKYMIKYGLNEISAVTQIEFVEITTPQTYCIIYTPSSYNASPIGRQNGGNIIHLQSGYFDLRNIKHETMHSMGFHHEQVRSDRDAYVDILWDNILSGKENNFQKQSIDDTYNIGSFDFYSIMIYSSDAFPKTAGLYTMLKKNGGTIPYNIQLSQGDEEGLNFIYGPEANLDAVVEYDYSTDYQNDRDIWYSNTIYFTNANNNPVVLSYPKLVEVTYYRETGSSNGVDARETTTNTIIVPAGVSSYNLGMTRDMEYTPGYGICERYEYSYYTITSF